MRCGDVEFSIHSSDELTEVGRITKKGAHFTRIMLTDADRFGVSFPIDLDVRIKATLLAATFLIVCLFI